MNKEAALAAWFLFALGIASPAHSGLGDLDVRFGTHGQTQIPGQVDSAALIPLPDGRILVFGVPEDPAARLEGAIGIARLLANGRPDASFGSGGHLELLLGSEAWPVPTDALLLKDGRILVAGFFRDKPTGARSATQGWFVRLSSDAGIDQTFGIGGVARAVSRGADRIALLADGAIAAAAPGLLHRLESSGAPAPFPGSEVSAVAIGSYDVSGMVLMSDGSVIAGSGYWDGWDYSLELVRVSASGERVRDWSASGAVGTFSLVGSLATDGDGTRLLACGSAFHRESVQEPLLVRRWQNDGQPDPTFAPSSGGRVELGVHDERLARCRVLLRDPQDRYVIAGNWIRSGHGWDGGDSILLARLDAFGAVDTTLDPSGRGRELVLGEAGRWSGSYVLDAGIAPDGAVLLLAQGGSEQRHFIARVEVSPSPGVGSIGFTDAAVRLAERRPGDLRVYRSGGSAGPISVRYEVLHDTTDGADVAPTAGTLTWADGDASARTIALVPVDDVAMEGEERFRVQLSDATGGAALGIPQIEVTLEDDEALRALHFAQSALRVSEGMHVDLTVMRPAATPGPIIVRYAVAPDLDRVDGSPRQGQHTRAANYHVGELRWSTDDTSSRKLQVSAYDYGLVDERPDDTIYVALADASGTLRDGADWKVARITVSDNPARSTPPPSSSPSPPLRSSGGGAVSFDMLSLLALALLVNFGREIFRRRSPKADATRQ